MSISQEQGLIKIDKFGGLANAFPDEKIPITNFKSLVNLRPTLTGLEKIKGYRKYIDTSILFDENGQKKENITNIIQFNPYPYNELKLVFGEQNIYIINEKDKKLELWKDITIDGFNKLSPRFSYSIYQNKLFIADKNSRPFYLEYKNVAYAKVKFFIDENDNRYLKAIDIEEKEIFREKWTNRISVTNPEIIAFNYPIIVIIANETISFFDVKEKKIIKENSLENIPVHNPSDGYYRIIDVTDDYVYVWGIIQQENKVYMLIFDYNGNKHENSFDPKPVGNGLAFENKLYYPIHTKEKSMLYLKYETSYNFSYSCSINTGPISVTPGNFWIGNKETNENISNILGIYILFNQNKLCVVYNSSKYKIKGEIYFVRESPWWIAGKFYIGFTGINSLIIKQFYGNLEFTTRTSDTTHYMLQVKTVKIILALELKGTLNVSFNQIEKIEIFPQGNDNLIRIYDLFIGFSNLNISWILIGLLLEEQDFKYHKGWAYAGDRYLNQNENNNRTYDYYKSLTSDLKITNSNIPAIEYYYSSKFYPNEIYVIQTKGINIDLYLIGQPIRCIPSIQIDPNSNLLSGIYTIQQSYFKNNLETYKSFEMSIEIPNDDNKYALEIYFGLPPDPEIEKRIIYIKYNNTTYIDIITDNNIEKKVYNSLPSSNWQYNPNIPLPPCKRVYNFLERILWISDIENKNMIYFSDTYYPESYATSNIRLVYHNDGDDIEGFYALYDRLYIFKKYHIYICNGDIATATIIKLSENIGCINFNTIKGIEDMIFFLSKQGICMIQRDEVKMLSYNLIDLSEYSEEDLLNSFADIDLQNYEYRLFIKNDIICFNIITQSFYIQKKSNFNYQCANQVEIEDNKLINLFAYNNHIFQDNIGNFFGNQKRFGYFKTGKISLREFENYFLTYMYYIRCRLNNYLLLKINDKDGFLCEPTLDDVYKGKLINYSQNYLQFELFERGPFDFKLFEYGVR